MTSSVRPFRKIASNLLWTPAGILRNPLVTVAADGSICCVASCAEPDRQPFAEFHAGLLIPDFPEDYRTVFAEMLARAEIPLPEQLADAVPARPGVLVVVSGLDYGTLRLTSRSRIDCLC